MDIVLDFSDSNMILGFCVYFLMCFLARTRTHDAEFNHRFAKWWDWVPQKSEYGPNNLSSNNPGRHNPPANKCFFLFFFRTYAFLIIQNLHKFCDILTFNHGFVHSAPVDNTPKAISTNKCFFEVFLPS